MDQSDSYHSRNPQNFQIAPQQRYPPRNNDSPLFKGSVVFCFPPFTVTVELFPTTTFRIPGAGWKVGEDGCYADQHLQGWRFGSNKYQKWQPGFEWFWYDVEDVFFVDYGYPDTQNHLIFSVFWKKFWRWQYIGWIFVSTKECGVLGLDRLIYRFCMNTMISYYLCTTLGTAIGLVIIPNVSIYIQMRSALWLRSAWGDVTRICIEKVLSCRKWLWGSSSTDHCETTLHSIPGIWWQTSARILTGKNSGWYWCNSHISARLSLDLSTYVSIYRSVYVHKQQKKLLTL